MYNAYTAMYNLTMTTIILSAGLISWPIASVLALRTLNGWICRREDRNAK